jgi:hypothetical protein
MWTVIAYKQAIDGESIIRIYDDSTEKSFEDYGNAIDYAGYISSKTPEYSVDIYEKYVYGKDELNMNDLKKQDALDKLTEEEKELLGLNP